MRREDRRASAADRERAEELADRATRCTTLRRPSANPHIARSANSSARSRSAADALRSSRLIELTFFDRRSKKGGFRLLSLACFFLPFKIGRASCRERV